MFHLIGTYDLEVSLNGGTPKSSIYKWILHHKPSILGIPILGNPNLNILKAQWQNLKMTHMYHLFDLLWFGDWLYHIIYHIYNIYIYLLDIQGTFHNWSKGNMFLSITVYGHGPSDRPSSIFSDFLVLFLVG